MGPTSVEHPCCAARVIVKNTFLDDWEDQDYVNQRQAGDRSIKTCPAFCTPEEPDVGACHSEGLADAQAKAIESVQTQNGAASTQKTSNKHCADDANPFFHETRARARGNKPWSCDAENASWQNLRKDSKDGASFQREVNSTATAGNECGRESRRQPLCERKKDLPCTEVSEGARASKQMRRGERNANRLWCHIYINQSMQKPGFDVNKKIIGHAGSGTKRIYDATGAKIRLRGRGSGHLEGGHEAPVPFMLTVTAEHWESDFFQKAVSMAVKLLEEVGARFHTFCKQRWIARLEEPCFWLGEASTHAKRYIGPAFDMR